MSVYEPTTWVNDNPPPLNEDNLNHAEQGTTDASTDLRDIGLGSTVVANAEVCGTSDFTATASETVVGGIKAYLSEDAHTGEFTAVLDTITIRDLPNPVVDFRASDNLPGVIRITFSETANSQWYDLFRDGVVVANDVTDGFDYQTSEGTWDFYVQANNVHGGVDGSPDSGTAYAIPTDVPADILDFTASDDKVQSVVIDWTSNHDAYTYDLYVGSTLIQNRVSRGDQIIVPEGTNTYKLKATNGFGDTYSNEDDGTAITLAPSVPQNFTASDGLAGEENATIVMNFDYIAQPSLYDLYRDTILHRNNIYDGYILNSPGGTWDFKVVATNSLGSAESNVDSGTANAALYPPEAVANLTATTDRILRIEFDFTVGLDTESMDLYQSAVGVDVYTLIATDVYPGFVLNSPVGTWDFKVLSVNSKGDTFSAPVVGEADAAFVGDPIITDFTMSTLAVSSIIPTFTVTNTQYCNLYRKDDHGSYLLYKDHVISGEGIPSFPGTWEFKLEAINPNNAISMEGVSGTVLPASSAPVFSPEDTFTASDTTPETPINNAIYMTYDAADSASRYDLFRSDNLHKEQITQPDYTLRSREGEWGFFVRATNLLGYADSARDDGSCGTANVPPPAPTNFLASGGTDGGGDAQYGKVTMTWDTTPDTISYDVYENDIVIASGLAVTNYTRELSAPIDAMYYVVAINRMGGGSPSTANQGIALAPLSPPSTITDVAATTDQLNQVTFTWSPATNATKYVLYRNGTLETVTEAGITSPYPFVIQGYNESTYNIMAINDQYETPSEPAVTGIAVAVLPGSVQINYNDYTPTGDVPDGTVTISNGVGTFIPPTGCTLVQLSMVAGGGGGGAGTESNDPGGGYAGDIYVGSADTTPAESIPLAIGVSGASVVAINEVSDPSVNGGAGGTTSFTGSLDVISLTGGSGGSGDGGFTGDGQSVTTDLGTANHGTSVTDNDTSWGGESCGLSDGGWAYEGWGSGDETSGSGGVGSGGGAMLLAFPDPDNDTYRSGAGGSGRITISWG